MNTKFIGGYLVWILLTSLVFFACSDSEEQGLRFEGCDGPVVIDEIAERQYSMAPYLINPTTEGVTIQWESMDDAPSYLLWGPEGAYDTCTCVPPPIRIPLISDEILEEHDGWLYSVTLSGLKPYTRYQYTLPGAQVPIPDAIGVYLGEQPEWADFGEQSFITAPEPGQDFSMIIFGDNQPLAHTHELVVNTMLLHPADVVVHMGDIVHNGQASQFRDVYVSMASPVLRRMPHFHIAGNHEGHGDVIPFDTLFPMPPGEAVIIDGTPLDPGPRVGIFDYGDARIFVLDSEREMGEGSAQLAWLDAQLENTVTEHPEFIWLFASWHRPTFSWSTSLMDGPRDALHEVLLRWKVDAVLNGHNHCYERFIQDGITYLVTGGGGAGLSAIDAIDPVPGENREGAALAFHIVHGEFTSAKASFRVIGAEDDAEIDTFELLVQDRSDL
ncbi:MAG: metallophosphoesterase family protein [Deltaproteobacteria bacterium]|nr:metallophosphoesterase family protein [Deltaproteobacteria bacterium]